MIGLEWNTMDDQWRGSFSIRSMEVCDNVIVMSVPAWSAYLSTIGSPVSSATHCYIVRASRARRRRSTSLFQSRRSEQLSNP